MNESKPKIRSTVNYIRMAGEDHPVSIRIDHGEMGGEQTVPYLQWQRPPEDADGHQDALTLILDDRLGLDLNGVSAPKQDEITEFIANAIAIGAGYASIYYLDRKMPFRG